MKKELLIVLYLLFILVNNAVGQGSLLITEKRVVFEGRQQKALINIVNTGNETETYTVSFTQRRMNEDGSFTVIQETDSTQKFASPYLRIYPRTITIAPSETQVVALQCRRTTDMIAGEYRSHLWFRQIENQSALDKENPKSESKELSFNIKALVGMTIPVIIRSGEAKLNVTLNNPKLESSQDSVHYLSFIIGRLGNISVYGDLIAEYIPIKGKPYIVGAVKGIAVYTNIDKRKVSIRLDETTGVDLKNGKIKLSYVSAEDAKKKEVFAETVLMLK